MFDLRSDLRLRPVASSLLLRQRPMAMGFGLDEAFGPGRVLTYDVALSAVGRTPPTRVSWPCSHSGNTGLSCTLAAVAATE
jgi:hypothetical protein